MEKYLKSNKWFVDSATTQPKEEKAKSQGDGIERWGGYACRGWWPLRVTEQPMCVCNNYSDRPPAAFKQWAKKPSKTSKSKGWPEVDAEFSYKRGAKLAASYSQILKKGKLVESDWEYGLTTDYCGDKGEQSLEGYAPLPLHKPASPDECIERLELLKQRVAEFDLSLMKNEPVSGRVHEQFRYSMDSFGGLIEHFCLNCPDALDAYVISCFLWRTPAFGLEFVQDFTDVADKLAKIEQFLYAYSRPNRYLTAARVIHKGVFSNKVGYYCLNLVALPN